MTALIFPLFSSVQVTNEGIFYGDNNLSLHSPLTRSQMRVFPYGGHFQRAQQILHHERDKQEQQVKVRTVESRRMNNDNRLSSGK